MLYMLIGVPASGKSTWLEQNADSGVVLSTDAHIDNVAAQQGKSYNDVFGDAIKKATVKMNNDLKQAVNRGEDIHWDQTNLTVKSRRGKLQKVPDTYEKIAVVFPTPDADEHQRRLDSRPGKTIPPHILKNMMATFQMPTTDEGFDRIVVI